VREGWPDYWPLSFKDEAQYARYMLGGDVLTGACSRVHLGQAALLPDHCCWYGVTCCMTEACYGDVMDLAACGCALGTVVKITLRSNNVSPLVL
jgi:hypothetical protein